MYCSTLRMHKIFNHDARDQPIMINNLVRFFCMPALLLIFAMIRHEFWAIRCSLLTPRLSIFIFATLWPWAFVIGISPFYIIKYVYDLEPPINLKDLNGLSALSFAIMGALYFYLIGRWGIMSLRIGSGHQQWAVRRQCKLERREAWIWRQMTGKDSTSRKGAD